jgi:hypothetical protein
VGWRWRERPVGHIGNPQRLGSHLGSERHLRCGGEGFFSYRFILPCVVADALDDVGSVLGNITARISSPEDSLTCTCVGFFRTGFLC